MTKRETWLLIGLATFASTTLALTTGMIDLWQRTRILQAKVLMLEAGPAEPGHEPATTLCDWTYDEIRTAHPLWHLEEAIRRQLVPPKPVTPPERIDTDGPGE